MTLPLARKEKLVVREMTDELLVYDLRSHQAHCLNQTAAFIWRRCDGRTGVAELAAMLSEKLGAEVSDNVVCLAVERLDALNLLEGWAAHPSGASKLSRREAVKRLGLAAAAVPVIMSVASPTAAQAQSPCNSTNCPPPRCCSAGLCVDESECNL